MADNVNVDLSGVSGEMNPTAEKRGFQKYVNDVELVLQSLRSGAAPAMLMGALNARRPWTLFVATDNFKVPPSVPRLSRRFYRNVEYFQANYLIVFLGLFAYCLSNIDCVGLLEVFLRLYVPESRLRSYLRPRERGPLAGVAARTALRSHTPAARAPALLNSVLVDNPQLDVFVTGIACLMRECQKLFERITTPLLLIAMVASFFGYKKLTSGPNNWKIAGWELTKTQQYAVAAGSSMAVCWLAGAGAVLFWVLGATVTVVALHASFFDAEALPAPEDPEQFPMIEQV